MKLNEACSQSRQNSRFIKSYANGTLCEKSYHQMHIFQLSSIDFNTPLKAKMQRFFSACHRNLSDALSFSHLLKDGKNWKKSTFFLYKDRKGQAFCTLSNAFCKKHHNYFFCVLILCHEITVDFKKEITNAKKQAKKPMI